MSLNLSLNPLVKAAATVVALSVAFVAQPAQKASAQVITGAGASSVTTLADFFRSDDVRYVVTGSGAGADAFANGDIDFVALDLNPGEGAGGSLLDPNGEIVFNEARINVTFPFNVPDFDGQLTEEQICGIFNGDITDWSDITGGDSLPIQRVFRGDVSGTTQLFQNNFIQPVCNDGLGFEIDLVTDQQEDGVNGTVIPNPNDNDIVVAAADDPFNDPDGDDNNSGSYSFGVASTVANTPGAIGYVEPVIANLFGLSLVTDADTGATSVAGDRTYFVFRQIYDTQEQADAATAVCLAVTDTNNLAAAGFDPDTEFGDNVADGGAFVCNFIL